MTVGKRGMGAHKHGTSGGIGPSPKTKFMSAFDANRLADEQKAKRKKPVMHRTIQEALKFK